MLCNWNGLGLICCWSKMWAQHCLSMGFWLLCLCRKPRLVLLEKALRLAQRHARHCNKPHLQCFFLGSVSVDAGHRSQSWSDHFISSHIRIDPTVCMCVMQMRRASLWLWTGLIPVGTSLDHQTGFRLLCCLVMFWFHVCSPHRTTYLKLLSNQRWSFITVSGWVMHLRLWCQPITVVMSSWVAVFHCQGNQFFTSPTPDLCVSHCSRCWAGDKLWICVRW